jgi:hypothetical protein
MARPMRWEHIVNETNTRERLVVWLGRAWHRAGLSPAGYADAYLIFIVEHDGSYGAIVNDAACETFPIAARGPFDTIDEARAWGIEVAEKRHDRGRQKTAPPLLRSVWDLVRRPAI